MYARRAQACIVAPLAAGCCCVLWSRNRHRAPARACSARVNAHTRSFECTPPCIRIKIENTQTQTNACTHPGTHAHTNAQMRTHTRHGPAAPPVSAMRLLLVCVTVSSPAAMPSGGPWGPYVSPPPMALGSFRCRRRKARGFRPPEATMHRGTTSTGVPLTGQPAPRDAWIVCLWQYLDAYTPAQLIVGFRVWS